MLKYSSAFLNGLATNLGFAEMMSGGVVRLFTGIRPNSANDAIPVGSIEVARLTTDGKTFYPGISNGAGLLFSAYNDGVLHGFGTWTLNGIAPGTAAWFRWNYAGLDYNSAGSNFPRIDGDVGVVGGDKKDLMLETASITIDTLANLEMFMFSLG